MSNLGLSKHRKSGTPPNQEHFTGKRKGKRIRRKGETHKQRKEKCGTHKNKYNDSH